MPDEELQVVTLFTEAKINGDNLLYMLDEPAGVQESLRINLASLFHYFYKIAPSITSNNLTLAIQHLDGTNPSTTSPMAFKIGNSIKVATGALSVTKNAGTNWCNAGAAELAANPIDFFVYVINETGASAGVKVGFSRIPYARTMADFINTTTSEKYIAGSWANFNSTDEVAVIGRFRAQLSAAASYNWSIASALVIHRPIHETDWLNLTLVPTNLTLGNGTVVYKYKLQMDVMNFHVSVIWGSTTSITGTGVSALLPMSASSVYPNIANFFAIGSCRLYDNGTASYVGVTQLNSVTAFNLQAQNAAATYLSLAQLSSTIPHTWANTDEMRGIGIYQVN